jgi:HmuY protein
MNTRPGTLAYRLFRFTSLSAGLLSMLFLLPLTGCDSGSGSGLDNEPVIAKRVTDLAADPFVGFVEGRPVGSGVMTYFSLREEAQVPAADSTSTRWDIGLRGTSIYVNGGTSGPGQGAAQIFEGLFEEIREAPETGWTVDGDQGTAILGGSGNGWYNYNPAAQTISPIPGRVLLVRTADGKYAKIRVVSYYKGAPETPTAESTARYYTFDYVLQPNGSRVFE